MKYNVSQLLKEQSGGIRQYSLHEDITALDPDITPLTTLDGNIQMIRTTDGVLVRGTLNTTVDVVCSRCVESFSLPVRFMLEEEFHPTIDMVTGAALPVMEEDEPATAIDSHHTLDLTEVVRQNILLAIPPYPVCRSKCAGLCPHCGQNWNEGTCNCTDDQIDPRFQVLQKLLDE